MFVAHALSYLVAGLLVCQLAKQLVGEGECSGRSLARGDVAVDGDQVIIGSYIMDFKE